MRRKLKLVSINDKPFIVYLDHICSLVELQKGLTVINVINSGSFTVNMSLLELEALIAEQENAE